MCAWFTQLWNCELILVKYIGPAYFLIIQFVPWKKLYHRYLMNEEQAVSKVDGILLNSGIEKESDLCVLNLIRWASFSCEEGILKSFLIRQCWWTHLCMSHRFTATTKCSPSVDPGRALWSLRDHPLRPEAEACVRQHLPDLYIAAGVCQGPMRNYVRKWTGFHLEKVCDSRLY